MFIRTVSIAQIVGICTAIISTDDWTTVDKVAIFRDLDECAKPCVRDIKVWDVLQKTTCRSYGCICSENTEGENFRNARANITECVKRSCSQDSVVVRTDSIFQKICLVQSLNVSKSSFEPGKSHIAFPISENTLTDG